MFSGWAMLCVFVAAIYDVPASAAEMPVLRTVAAIRALTPIEAGRGLPVELRAVVTYYDPPEHILFIRDATAGIYVETGAPLPIKAGSRVIVSGVSAPGYTNTITKSTVQELSRGLRPAAPEVTIARLLRGDLDCEYVTTSGVVRAAFITTEAHTSYLEIRLESHGQVVDVQVQHYQGIDVASLIGSKVRVTGAAGGDFNDRNQLAGILLSVQGTEDVQLIRPAAGNPFEQTLMPMASLLKYRTAAQIGQRTRVRGLVTYVQPGSYVVIQEANEPLMVRTRQATPLAIGDEVDVTGFPAFGEYSPELQDANYRRTGVNREVRPADIDANKALIGAYDSHLVTVEAELVSVARNSAGYTLGLASGNTVFSGVVDDGANERLVGLTAGSRLRVSGICVIQTAGIWRMVRGFRILLRSGNDVAVITTPPWWNARRLIFAVGSLLAIVLGSLGWVLVLRRRVNAQTLEIRRVLEEDAARDKRLAALQEARSEVLERINSREPLPTVLGAIAALVEEQVTGAFCCVHLLEEDGRLTLVSEPCSSPELADRLKQIEVVPDGHVCGQAVIEQKPCTRPGEEWACAWPVFASSGKIAGVVSLLRATGANETGLAELLDLAAQLSALAIDNRRLYDSLTYRLRHDYLTGLPNRLRLDEQLVIAMAGAQRRHQHLAIAYIDLDGFKQVNDIYGHRAGDVCLQRAAERFRGALRDGDLLARVGGDEFIAVSEGIQTREEAHDIARRMLEALEKPLLLSDGHDLICRASIGIALFPDDGCTPDELKRKADEAMYAAKSGGKHQLHICDPKPKQDQNRTIAAVELRRAIEDGDLRLHYQPMFAMRGELVGFEALVRLVGPSGELVPPAGFIDTAEKSGLILPLGKWVLRHACRQAALWQRRTGRGLRMSVNVSARQLAEPGLVEGVFEVLTETGLPPHLLELELTEAVLVENFEAAIEQIHRLRRVGVRFALDDFGTGFSSLSMVHSLPVDVIKIDRSFVLALMGTPTSLPIMQAIFALASTIGAETVAEGIEYAEQIAYLKRLGCTAVQGFGFAKPMPAESINLRMAEWLDSTFDLLDRLDAPPGLAKEHVLHSGD